MESAARPLRGEAPCPAPAQLSAHRRGEAGGAQDRTRGAEAGAAHVLWETQSTQTEPAFPGTF